MSLSQRSLISETITTALAAVIRGSNSGFYGMNALVIEGRFVYGSDGTTVKVWIQTSLDDGGNWIDIASLAFATTSLRTVHTLVLPAVVADRTKVTPTDGALADDLIVDGILGDMIRAKLTTVGTYAGGTTLDVNIVPKG